MQAHRAAKLRPSGLSEQDSGAGPGPGLCLCSRLLTLSPHLLPDCLSSAREVCKPQDCDNTSLPNGRCAHHHCHGGPTCSLIVHFCSSFSPQTSTEPALCQPYAGLQGPRGDCAWRKGWLLAFFWNPPLSPLSSSMVLSDQQSTLISLPGGPLRPLYSPLLTHTCTFKF